MRPILMLLFLAGCTSTPDPLPVTEPEVTFTEPVTQETLVGEIELLVAERNRLQRQLFSISTYQLDLPVDIRDAIHCGTVLSDPIPLPNSNYLKVASKLVTNPAQMEGLLLGYIKMLIRNLEEANRQIEIKNQSILECYDKFKP